MFSKGLVFNCQLTITVDGSAASATIGLSQGFCVLVMFGSSPLTSPPYPVSFTEGPAGSGTFTIHNIEADTYPSGGCRGDITGTWNGTTLYFDTTLPPKVAGTGDCRLVGSAQKVE